MIKANELRIGNFILEGGKFYEIRHSDFEVADLNYNSETQSFYITGDPIPLTPEILEQCGFEQSANANDDSLVFSNNFFVIDLYSSEMCLENAWAEALCIEIKYLHQLQNLYFALTGKELTVNHTALSPLH